MHQLALQHIALHPAGLRTITLAVAPSNPTNFQFEAGQYLGVMHPNGTLIPLSIASGPAKLPLVELLYRSDLTSETAQAFDDLLRSRSHLNIDGPFGDVTLAKVKPTQSLRIVASGTGVAQALSLVDEIGRLNQQRPTQVLWATQIQTPTSNRLLTNQSWLRVTRCSSHSLPAELLASVEQSRVETGASNTRNLITIIAGPPDFVYQVTDTLLAAGVSQHSLAADAFTYAPR